MTFTSTAEPSPGRIVRTLKDGYWDRTEVIELADGTQRVRKRNKGATAPGPWGVESLRREIQYLRSLSPPASGVLPRLLASWDREAGGTPELGYEIPFYSDHADAGELARREALPQAEAEEFQRELASAVLDKLHEPASPREPLSRHLLAAVRQAFAGLAAEPDFAALIAAETIQLNGRTQFGPRAALEKIAAGEVLSVLDAPPAVRIHGDFFLENILWRRTPTAGGEPRLILIDPVSVAGVDRALPLFDLVKYESYATGELLALRTEKVEVAGYGAGNGVYCYSIRWEDPTLQPFRTIDWHRSFRRAYEAKYGTLDQRLYRLLDGYFSAAMAVNTFGAQRQARLLKATADFNAVLV